MHAERVSVVLKIIANNNNNNSLLDENKMGTEGLGSGYIGTYLQIAACCLMSSPLISLC